MRNRSASATLLMVRKLLACTTAENRGYALKQSLKSLSFSLKCKYNIQVVSKDLFDTITTLHDGWVYRHRATVQRRPVTFDSLELDMLRQIKKRAKVSDKLTKENLEMHKLFDSISIEGVLKFQITDHTSCTARTRRNWQDLCACGYVIRLWLVLSALLYTLVMAYTK